MYFNKNLKEMYCGVSMATVVMRTCHNSTVYTHCLSRVVVSFLVKSVAIFNNEIVGGLHNPPERSEDEKNLFFLPVI
jgi:hypothetical protein